MTNLGVPIVFADLTASFSTESGTVHLRLSGTADLRVTETVERLLSQIHKQARSSRASEVRVDFRELEFMNSSCFKSFVSWISQVQELPTAEQYRIRFLSSPAILWQRRSLHALSCFAADLVSIEAG